MATTFPVPYKEGQFLENVFHELVGSKLSRDNLKDIFSFLSSFLFFMICNISMMLPSDQRESVYTYFR